MSFHRTKSFSRAIPLVSLSAHTYVSIYDIFYMHTDRSTHTHVTYIHIHKHTSTDI